MEENVYRKIIAFDLSKSELEKAGFSVIFPRAMEPYNQILKVMKSLGFEHLQKSTYLSKSTMSDTGLAQTIEELDLRLPWLNACVLKIHTADVINEQSFDVKDALNNANVLHKQQEITLFDIEAE